jgi:phosphoribosylformimino-5-aminoimidazole carboxamide ribotide isomerase
VVLYPAIDIRDGHAVRLMQGDYERETAYEDDPVDAATRFQEEGAEWLHVVDLDGAREGESKNLDHLERIGAAVTLPIQFGGGLRDSGKVEAAISAGVERVVLGTAAIDDHDFVSAVTEVHGDRVAVSVDARGGRISRQGWTEGTEITPAELIAPLCERGVRRFIYTPVEADGLMEGPMLDDLGAVAAAAEQGGAVLTYSGGIGTLEDLQRLAELELPALSGVIVGRALYEGRFTIAEARAVLGD